MSRRTEEHPVFAHLRSLAAAAPVVVAHRGDSARFPENTLPAFASARALGVAMQEFDVRTTRDGVLVCIHDESVDRTTDGSSVLGPGALVAQLRFAELQRLDAGSWFGPAHAGARIPTLEQVLAAVAPGIAMIEHKAGDPQAYVDALRATGRTGTVLLQSFDWEFVRWTGRLAPEIALGVLGPHRPGAIVDDELVQQAVDLGAGLLHWSAAQLHREGLARIRGAGLLSCSYTTDDEAGWAGQAVLGIDAICSNRPGALMAAQRTGRPARRDQ